MASRRRDLLDFLREHKGLFATSRHLRHVAMRRVPFPSTAGVTFDPLETAELAMFTFGQLLGCSAERADLTLSQLADRLAMTQEEVVQLCDDQVFPWDLDPTTIVRCSEVLSMPLQLVAEVVARQPLEDRVLRERVPRHDMVARLPQRLNEEQRRQALMGSAIKIQRHREDRRRRELVRVLRERLPFSSR